MKKQKPYTFNSITSDLAKREGGKSQSNIGDIREAYSKMCVLMALDSRFVAFCIQTGVNKIRRGNK